MNIEELYKIFLSSSEITIDSRNVIKGSIFFALKGENFNGNLFAESAIQKGARFAIIDEKQCKLNKKFILVDNVLKTLQKLANFHRNKLNPKVIGITGSNGKTTTKELINKVLETKYKTIYTKGNLNNHIGVPLTLLSIKTDTEIAIIEMGANHRGDIKELCEIADPNFGIITNIGKAHLAGFGSIDGVIKTKTELYKHIENKDGLIFINIDNSILTQNNNVKNKYTYSLSKESDIKGEKISSDPFLKIFWYINNEKILIETNLVGAYNAENVLAAITIGKYFNIENNIILTALKNYIPSNNRSQLMIKGTNNIYIDSYNANPSSMEASILNFYKLNIHNKVLILGDMLELGNSSIEEHFNIIKLIIQCKFEKVFLVGQIFANLDTTFNKYSTIESLNQHLINTPIINSNILLKGSRGIKLEKVLDII